MTLLNTLEDESKHCLCVQNVGEDSDEMFDELFNKYGKVVYKSDDQKSVTAEVDDDAESLTCNRKPYSNIFLYLLASISDGECVY